MDARTGFRLTVITLASCLTSSAFGGWAEFRQRAALDFHRANAWPQPFVEMDRIATCSPFVIMAENGWLQQSTLTSFHFDPNTDQLTEAGRLRVQQILFTHPQAYRTVYVVQGISPEQSTSRVESVRDVLAQTKTDGTGDVRLTVIEPRGMPADEIEAISAKLRATVPDPRLPAAAAAGGTP